MIADVATRNPSHLTGPTLGDGKSYTDTDPVTGGQYRNNHALSAARLAVYEVLVNGQHFRPDQLFVVGHGPNHPVVSNGTLAGKQRNRRVELVIYPDRVAQ